MKQIRIRHIRKFIYIYIYIYIYIHKIYTYIYLYIYIYIKDRRNIITINKYVPNRLDEHFVTWSVVHKKMA